VQHTVLFVPGLNITRTKRNAEIVAGKTPGVHCRERISHHQLM
jgi:hypothetical protein